MGSLTTFLVPDLNFGQCCDKHDFDYGVGGSEADRLKADEEFHRCIQKHAGTTIANIYYAAVRILGEDRFTHYFYEEGSGKVGKMNTIDMVVRKIKEKEERREKADANLNLYIKAVGFQAALEISPSMFQAFLRDGILLAIEASGKSVVDDPELKEWMEFLKITEKNLSTLFSQKTTASPTPSSNNISGNSNGAQTLDVSLNLPSNNSASSILNGLNLDDLRVKPRSELEQVSDTIMSDIIYSDRLF
jgi:Cdc6-like AAA superfamily ATPase